MRAGGRITRLGLGWCSDCSRLLHLCSNRLDSRTGQKGAWMAATWVWGWEGVEGGCARAGGQGCGWEGVGGDGLMRTHAPSGLRCVHTLVDVELPCCADALRAQRTKHAPPPPPANPAKG